MEGNPFEITDAHFCKGYLETDTPAYRSVTKNDKDLVQIVRDLMNDADESSEQFTRNVGFLFGLLYTGDVVLHISQEDEGQPPTEPKPVL